MLETVLLFFQKEFPQFKKKKKKLAYKNFGQKKLSQK